jgi:hypothetical protein
MKTISGKIIQGMFDKHQFWIRIFGKGITARNINKTYGLLFSERNGYKKYIKMGNWVISYLRKPF